MKRLSNDTLFGCCGARTQTQHTHAHAASHDDICILVMRIENKIKWYEWQVAACTNAHPHALTPAYFKLISPWISSAKIVITQNHVHIIKIFMFGREGIDGKWNRIISWPHTEVGIAQMDPVNGVPSNFEAIVKFWWNFFSYFTQKCQQKKENTKSRTKQFHIVLLYMYIIQLTERDSDFAK